MINIKKYEKNIIYYECGCGIKGICSFKPMNREAAIVIDIKCPSCHEIERLTLIQYDNENSKRSMINNINNIDLSWVPSINEEVLYNGDE
jgi:hypothetical protein